MGIMGSIRFCDKMSHWVQPPDAENRMSGGVAEVTGEIPSPRADRVWLAVQTLIHVKPLPDSPQNFR
jgi:hypothetical protein